jgi:hypothetical protein
MARRVLLDTHVVVDIATEDRFEALPAKVRRNKVLLQRLP